MGHCFLLVVTVAAAAVTVVADQQQLGWQHGPFVELAPNQTAFDTGHIIFPQAVFPVGPCRLDPLRVGWFNERNGCRFRPLSNAAGRPQRGTARVISQLRTLATVDVPYAAPFRYLVGVYGTDDASTRRFLFIEWNNVTNGCPVWVMPESDGVTPPQDPSWCLEQMVLARWAQRAGNEYHASGHPPQPEQAFASMTHFLNSTNAFVLMGNGSRDPTEIMQDTFATLRRTNRAADDSGLVDLDYDYSSDDLPPPPSPPPPPPPPPSMIPNFDGGGDGGGDEADTLDGVDDGDGDGDGGDDGGGDETPVDVADEANDNEADEYIDTTTNVEAAAAEAAAAEAKTRAAKEAAAAEEARAKEEEARAKEEEARAKEEEARAKEAAAAAAAATTTAPAAAPTTTTTTTTPTTTPTTTTTAAAVVAAPFTPVFAAVTSVAAPPSDAVANGDRGEPDGDRSLLFAAVGLGSGLLLVVLIVAAYYGRRVHRKYRVQTSATHVGNVLQKTGDDAAAATTTTQQQEAPPPQHLKPVQRANTILLTPVPKPMQPTTTTTHNGVLYTNLPMV